MSQIQLASPSFNGREWPIVVRRTRKTADGRVTVVVRENKTDGRAVVVGTREGPDPRILVQPLPNRGVGKKTLRELIRAL